MEKDFKSRLKELRIAKGFTRKEMAKAIGIEVTTYANYEGGFRMPKWDKILKIAKCLNVSTDYLLGANSTR